MAMGDCEIEGCDRLVKALGLCDMHYNRRRRGLPVDGPVQRGGPQVKMKWPKVKRRQGPRSECCLIGCGDKVGEGLDLCPVHDKRITELRFQEGVKLLRDGRVM